MTNLYLQSPSLLCLDFMTGAKSRNPIGAMRVFFPLSLCFSRKQIQVDEIFVHESFTKTGDKVNDIALLRLGNSIFRMIFDSTGLRMISDYTRFNVRESCKLWSLAWFHSILKRNGIGTTKWQLNDNRMTNQEDPFASLLYKEWHGQNYGGMTKFMG